MEIDIVEGLNRIIEEERKILNIQSTSHLIAHTKVVNTGTFKAYKEYTISLWFIKEKQRILILEYSKVSSERNKIYLDLYMGFTLKILRLFKSTDFNKIIENTYGTSNE